MVDWKFWIASVVIPLVMGFVGATGGIYINNESNIITDINMDDFINKDHATANFGNTAEITGAGTLTSAEKDFVIAAEKDLLLPQATYNSGNFTIGEKDARQKVLVQQANGTQFVFETFQPLHILTLTQNGSHTKCYVNDSFNWICKAK